MFVKSALKVASLQSRSDYTVIFVNDMHVMSRDKIRGLSLRTKTFSPNVRSIVTLSADIFISN